ncbi:hypothetical protein JCM10212_002794 [Sporobolomyces blumeae]
MDRLPRLPFDVVALVAEMIWHGSTEAEARQTGYSMSFVCHEWYPLGQSLIDRRLMLGDSQNDHFVVRRLFDPASNLPRHVSELGLSWILSSFKLPQDLASTLARCLRLEQLEICDSPGIVSYVVRMICSSPMPGRLKCLTLIYPLDDSRDDIDFSDVTRLEQAETLVKVSITISLQRDPVIWDMIEELEEDEYDEEPSEDSDRLNSTLTSFVTVEFERLGRDFAVNVDLSSLSTTAAGLFLGIYGDRFVEMVSPYFDVSRRLTALSAAVPPKETAEAVACLARSIGRLPSLKVLQISALDQVKLDVEPVRVSDLDLLFRNLPTSIISVSLDAIVDADHLSTIATLLDSRRHSTLMHLETLRVGFEDDDENVDEAMTRIVLVCTWFRMPTRSGTGCWLYSEKPFCEA